MLRHLSVMLVFFLSLAGIVHYGNQIRVNWLPETTDPDPVLTASIKARAQSSVSASHALHKISRAKPTDAHITSNMTFHSENLTIQTIVTSETTHLTTTHSALLTSTVIHTQTSTLAPHTSPVTSTSHMAASRTAATLDPVTASGSWLPTTSPSSLASVSSPSTLNHTTGKPTQSSHHTVLPAMLSTSPHTDTASEASIQPTPTTHNATQPAPPTGSAPGPTMVPQPAAVKTGTYQVLNGSRLCIKAEMGLELMVQEMDSVFSPKSYFSIDPNTTQTYGNCSFRKSNLLVNFPGGFVNFTFTKDENSYYVSEVSAYLTISNPEKVYSGIKKSLLMFEAVLGHSFKCVSEQSIQLSRHLQLKMMNTQLQAFDFEGDHFGNADDCFSDISRAETPVAVGLSIAVLFVILLSACLVSRKKPVDECSSDYTVVLPVIGAIVLGLCAVGLIVYGIRLRRESSGYQRI